MSYEEEDERIEREAKDFAKQKAIHAEITALESRCARQAELLERAISYVARGVVDFETYSGLVADYEAFRKEAGNE